MQIYAGAGAKIRLTQPTYDNYVVASHYYGQTRKAGIVKPFPEVRLSHDRRQCPKSDRLLLQKPRLGCMWLVNCTVIHCGRLWRAG